MSSNSRNLKSSFLTTRCLYWGVDLPVNQQIWALTVEISSDHSWPLDASARVVDLTIDLPIWALTVEISNCHSWPLDASASGGWSASWSANISSNSRNLRSPFLTTRCLYWRSRSAIWSANMSYNSRNLKSPFLTTRCLYWGGDLLVDWPIWVLTIEISSHHSWLLDASSGGEICQFICQIWALKVEISSHHSWPLDASTSGGWSASWSANMSSNSRNLKLPSLTTRYLYWGVDLPVEMPIWALTVEISSHHSWPLDASTGGVDLPVDWPIWVLTIEMSSHHS